MITPEAQHFVEKLHVDALAGKDVSDWFPLMRRLLRVGPVVWQWDKPFSDPNARMYMGLQKNPDGTGFSRLNAGDSPRNCEYCGGSRVYTFPHSHTKADKERVR